ncbi:MarR family winged helix-turn-helix transcriptional regulator [Novosphingobium terrae]|uniref:MarR family winged helix-turn-helix transcriptional regulator n=1 Tax=Novosphingobium terrae TaxID=2726189 RepID=UPI00197F1C98|nr:MarR family transcriptional regulator [Novosphingobium terrae]
MKNPLDAYPGYLLRRAAATRLAYLTRRLEPLGVMVTEASILVTIGYNPGISQAECGRALAIQRPNMNPLVRRMVERGWVVTEKGQGRAQGLHLSPTGADLAARIEAIFEAHEAWIIAAVPVEAREHLMPILRALNVIGDEDPAEHAGENADGWLSRKSQTAI